MWRFLLIFAILQTVHCSCRPGFEIVNGECRGNYTRINTFFDVRATTDTVAKCKEILSMPIIIHTDDDQNYWSGQIGSDWTVIGLMCNSTTGKWEWADGSASDYKPSKVLDSSVNSTLSSQCTNKEFDWLLRGDGTWTFGSGHAEFISDIFCAAQLRQPIESDDECLNFEDDSEDGVCYQVGEAAESWIDAQFTCIQLGANLASIHNSQENSFVRRLAVSKGAVNGLFLGGTIAGKGTEFGWIDATDWDYENFYPGFPLPGIGDCIAMDTSTSAGLWMNIDCSTNLPVACIREANAFAVQNCETGFSEEGKVITSPGFPYNASTPCEYFLDVEEGKGVELEIVFLEANPCCDFLVIHDGYLGGSMIANITGEKRNVKYTSPSNLMRVSWQPNQGENVRGVAMTYRGV